MKTATQRKVFVPKAACSVPSGDCFTKGKCLDDCENRSHVDDQERIRALYEAMVRLEVRVLRLEQKVSA